MGARGSSRPKRTRLPGFRGAAVMLALPGLVAAAPAIAASQGVAPDWLRMGMAHAVSEPDSAAAHAVRALKPPFRDLVASVLALQARDLGDPGGRQLENFRLEMEYVECVRRIYALCKRLADSIAAPHPDTLAAQ